MRNYMKFASLAACLYAAPLVAQTPTEYGIDSGATFGFGDVSSVEIRLPASRLRVAYPRSPKLSLEPVAGVAYSKTEGTDGVLIYSLEAGALYNLQPFVPAGADASAPATSAYLRPFAGLTGFTGGDTSDTEFFAGAGIGVKVPWQEDLAWRLEANVGYGFDNKATRVGLLAGLSFFAR
jgi:hypothetical protein